MAAVTAHPLLEEVFTALRGQGRWLKGAVLHCDPPHGIDNSLVAIGASHRLDPDPVAGVISGLMGQEH